MIVDAEDASNALDELRQGRKDLQPYAEDARDAQRLGQAIAAVIARAAANDPIRPPPQVSSAQREGDMAATKNDTPDRLRAEIDYGSTGDKSPGSDPAAAPLGTDEEAGGQRVTPEQVATARLHEVKGPPRSERRRGLKAIWAIVVFALLLAAVFGFAFFRSHAGAS